MLPADRLIVRSFEGNDDIIIYPISDVHLGAEEHMTRAWEQFCQTVLNQENAYLILGGDLMNNATRSSVSNIFHETMSPSMQKKVLTKMLEPLKDRVLCGVPGNHERRSEKDADNEPLYDIMCKLDIEDRYRHDIAFLKIQLGDRTIGSGSRRNGARRPTYLLVITHGAGGGMLTGGMLNKSERFGYTIDGADALIVGHSHKVFASSPFKLKVDLHNNIVTKIPFKVISMSSWLEWGGYAAQKMLLPSGYVKQVIKLNGKHKELTVEM